MTIRPMFAVAVLSAAAMPNPASAATLIFQGTFSGSQEVPPNASPGTGTSTVTYDTETSILNVQANFANLIGNTTMAHIHCCALPGANAGVVTPTPSFPGFPLGVTSGSYSRTFDLTLASSFNTAFVNANGGSVTAARTTFINGLQAGQAYFNIHTTSFPGGEIRAQLAAVPEPGSWALMLAGFGAIGFALRQRRRVTARPLQKA